MKDSKTENRAQSGGNSPPSPSSTEPNHSDSIAPAQNAGQNTERNIGVHWCIFFGLAVVGLAADLGTKQWVFSAMGLPGESDPVWWIDGMLGIQTAVNMGAVFGIGQGKGLFFAGFSVVATIGVLVWLYRFRAIESRYLTVTLGMITGGIFGNLYDRLGLWTGPWKDHPLFLDGWNSGVRDWILFRLEGVPFFDPWPNFNIADSLLVIGAGMLVVHSLFFASPIETPTDESAADTSSSSTAVGTAAKT